MSLVHWKCQYMWTNHRFNLTIFPFHTSLLVIKNISLSYKFVLEGCFCQIQPYLLVQVYYREVCVFCSISSLILYQFVLKHKVEINKKIESSSLYQCSKIEIIHSSSLLYHKTQIEIIQNSSLLSPKTQNWNSS